MFKFNKGDYFLIYYKNGAEELKKVCKILEQKGYRRTWNNSFFDRILAKEEGCATIYIVGDNYFHCSLKKTKLNRERSLTELIYQNFDIE